MYFRGKYAIVIITVILCAFLLFWSSVDNQPESNLLPNVTLELETMPLQTPKSIPDLMREETFEEPTFSNTAPFQGHTDQYNSKYLNAPDGSLKGNKRCIVPLLLTDTKYHGTRLLATTIKGWIKKLFIPQKTLDLVIYYDSKRVGLLSSIIDLLSLTAAHPPSTTGPYAKQGVLESLSEGDRELLQPSGGYFKTPHDPTFTLQIVPTTVPYPQYIIDEPSLLNRSDWMRCGCPPYCPVKRATESYIQGTRWYTYDLFLEPTIAPYTYWMKIDVDIWLFRELNLNVVDEMAAKKALVAHTGAIFNGGGCSNSLHKAIIEYYNCSFEPISRQPQGSRSTICDDGRIVSASRNWWKQDDGVYYTNFVVYSVHFFLDPQVLELSRYLNEYRDGFFRYRWTDQSLAHKVLGVFAGPDEDSFRLDWSHLRWKRGRYRSEAAFWHGKSGKNKKDLGKYTKLTKDVYYYR